MPLTKQDLAVLSLEDLVLNICCFSEGHLLHEACEICEQYVKWNEELVKNIWKKEEYIDFDYFVDVLKTRNKSILNLGKISNATKHTYLKIIQK